jgi:hypothetical protein
MLTLKKETKIITFCILLSAICILFLSCFNPFSPSVIGPGALKPIAPQVDPDSVLYNFKYAYENRDSVVYENCLDEDFKFTYWDQLKVGDAIEETEFGQSQDLKATNNLFRTFEDIRLDKWKVDSLPDMTVGEELWKARKVEFHLSVWDIDGEYQNMEANGFAEFYFRRSDQDNLWRIVHWIDNSNR